jgi:hypothetical protein
MSVFSSRVVFCSPWRNRENIPSGVDVSCSFVGAALGISGAGVASFALGAEPAADGSLDVCDFVLKRSKIPTVE